MAARNSNSVPRSRVNMGEVLFRNEYTYLEMNCHDLKPPPSICEQI
jgi:hypothetical protein